MPPRKTPKLITPATQQRSRDTHEAIVRAFRQALSTTPYDEISIADLARRAGVSVGGFYARFTTKDALLLPLIEDTIAELTATLDDALDAVDRADGSLADVCSAYVRGMVFEFRKQLRVVQHVRQSARGDAAAAIGERVHAFNEHAHARFRAAAWARRKEIHHRSPRAAIEIGLFIASAAAREAVTPANWWSYTVQPDDATLMREITASLIAYLTTKSSAG